MQACTASIAHVAESDEDSWHTCLAKENSILCSTCNNNLLESHRVK